MLATALNRWKLFPITLIFVTISLTLFVAENAYRIQDTEGVADIGRSLGLATTRIRLDHGQQVEGLKGPFDVWDGQVWRFMVNAFAHIGFVHLIGNLVGLVLLGYWLETRIRWFDYLFFYLFAGFGSILLEYIMHGSVAVGTSGAIYALFGRLLVMRFSDEELQEGFPEFLVGLFLIWLVLCVPLATSGLMPIANWAHFFGFFYGAIFGLLQLSTKWVWSRRMAVGSFAFAHLLVVPGMYLAVHPVWNGAYQWYRSETAGPFARERLQKAVECDPGLAGAWLDLAGKESSISEAIHSLAQGVWHNRTDEKLNRIFERNMELMRESGSLKQKLQTVETVKSVFGDEAETWLARLDWAPPTVMTLSSGVVEDPVRSDSQLQSPSVDPKDPNSAAIGETL